MDAAKALQDAGVFALVMECIPYDLAEEITAALEIPTIGIGAGPHCDGQVLVTHDMLGLGFGHQAKFVRRFAELGQQAGAAIAEYVAAVEDGSFPSLNESYRSPKKESIRKIYGGG
jgi:3-methyl-2-oxobutanoate hydroxymethyltransferase